ncbi:MAG: pilus assembly protein N-terminal domain-containing protein [Pseudomonadota bacterium]|nr:pilus assembly protein N-terminal domain-containing protein [Pseudomonadota bacterium]
MRRYFIKLSIFFVLFPTFCFANIKLELHVGSIEVLPVSKVTRVVVGQGGVVSTKVLDDNRLLLIAEGAGQTEIQIWNATNQTQKIYVNVDPTNMNELEQQVQSLVRDLPGVKARKLGSLVVLEGEVTADVIAKAESLSEMIPNLTSMLSLAPTTVDLKHMIRMDVQIVEMRNNTLKNIGIKWGSAMAGPAYGGIKNFVTNDIFSVYTENPMGDQIVDAVGNMAIGNSGYAAFGIATGLTSQIQLLDEQGDSRTLAEPTLSTRSGEKARFLAGGEVPIPIVDSNGGLNVEYKEYGIKLEIEPTSDAKGNIVSFVRAEVSSIDPSVTVGDYPGFQTRETESVVNVKNGETLVISGLVSSDMSKSVNKVPLLGDIPILGELFKSRDFIDKKSELIILVTPKIVPIDDESQQNRLQRAKELIGEANKLEMFNILD